MFSFGIVLISILIPWTKRNMMKKQELKIKESESGKYIQLLLSSILNQKCPKSDVKPGDPTTNYNRIPPRGYSTPTNMNKSFTESISDLYKRTGVSKAESPSTSSPTPSASNTP